MDSKQIITDVIAILVMLWFTGFFISQGEVTMSLLFLAFTSYKTMNFLSNL